MILENAEKYKSNASIQGVLVQEMVKDGIEVVVGMSQDPQFGPVVMFGVGGVFVEVLRDVSFRIPPISCSDAKEMIRETQGYKALEGTRGRKQAGIDSLINVITRFSYLCKDLKNYITEAEINPLVVFKNRRWVKALDALIILR